MQFEAFQDRQSKYLKPLAYENYQQDREKYMIDLRKTKRREYFQKYRLAQAGPKTKLLIPPRFLEENPSLLTLSLEDHFPFILLHLRSRSNLKETLDYLITLLKNIDCKAEDPEFFSELVELTSSQAELKDLAYQALFEYSSACQVSPQPGQMSTILKEAAGVDKKLLIFLCLNIIIDEKIASVDAEMVVSCIFIDDLAKAVYSPAAELLKVLTKLNYKEVDLNPALLWLVKHFSQEIQGQACWIDLFLNAYKDQNVFKTKKLLKNGLVEKVLQTVQRFPDFTSRGLKILRNVFNTKHVEEFLNDADVKRLEVYLQEGENKAKFQAFMILTKVIGKKTKQAFSDELVKKLFTSLARFEERPDVYCLKLLDSALEKFPALSQTYLKFGFLKTLSSLRLGGLDKKLNKFVLNICSKLLDGDAEVIHEFCQNGIFEMIEAIEEFYDEDTENNYHDILELNPESQELCISSNDEFRFS